MSDDRYRPCEDPACGAIDSTRCAFRTSDLTGMVVPSQLDKAKAAGCRVARFDRPTDPYELAEVIIAETPGLEQIAAEAGQTVEDAAFEMAIQELQT